MSQRTTIPLVRGILTKDAPDDLAAGLQPFIDSATVIVDRVVTCASARGRALTAGEAELVERWLSAHFWKFARDKQIMSQSTGPINVTYAGTEAMQTGTTYRATAIALDPSGCLDAILNGRRPRAFWAGKRPSEQTPYVRRN